MGSPENAEEEQSIFNAFLEARPLFAGEKIIRWSLAPDDPPDMVCVTESGVRIGVEITQWIHERELAAGKRRERIEQALMSAIGTPQPRNRSRRFSLVVFFPKASVRFCGSESGVFRHSLFESIDHVDQNWPLTPSRQAHTFRDLARFPPVDKYLAQIHFVAGSSEASPYEWIVPVRRTDSFNERTMIEPLLTRVDIKIGKCRTLKTECDALYLVIAHDQASGYCSPVTTRISRILEEVASMASTNHWPFRNVFLLKGGNVFSVPTAAQ